MISHLYYICCMKNILLLLTLFISLQVANAQYVTIPDANDVANGTYLLSLDMNGNVSTSKVVIVR